MDPVVSYGKRKRGSLGQVAKWLFIGFNILMLIWLVSASFATSDLSSTTEGSAGRAGVAIGAMLGFGMLLFVWFVGAMILGVAAFLSRGDRMIIVSDGSGESRALGPGPEHQPNTNAKALKVAAWAATLLAVLGMVSELSDGDLLGALLSFLVGLCAVPLIWHHPAVERKRVPVGARWAAALIFLALGPLLNSSPSSDSSPKESADAISQWEVIEEKSAMDDSQTVVASVGAEKEVVGWLGSQKPHLYLRCQEGELELYVDTGTQVATDFSLERGKVAEARYRIGDDPPVKVSVEPSTDGKAFFLPAPSKIIRRLIAAKRLAVEYTPFNAGPGTAVFNTVGIETVLSKMPATCQAGAMEGDGGKTAASAVRGGQSAAASSSVSPALIQQCFGQFHDDESQMELLVKNDPVSVKVDFSDAAGTPTTRATPTRSGFTFAGKGALEGGMYQVECHPKYVRVIPPSGSYLEGPRTALRGPGRWEAIE